MTTRAFTASIELVRTLADRARDSKTGIRVRFIVGHNVETLEAARTRARALQQAYSSLRTRARRLTHDDKKQANNYIRGPYDKIMCNYTPLANDRGYEVFFTQGASVLEDLIVIDDDTGEEIDFVPSRRDELINMLSYDFAAFTPAHWDELHALDPRALAIANLDRVDCDGRASIFDTPLRLARGSAGSNDLLLVAKPGNLFDDPEPEEEGVQADTLTET